MDYVTLKKARYKPNFNLEDEYKKRRSGFATYELPLTKRGYNVSTQFDLFIFSTTEMNELIFNILELDNLICYRMTQLPPVAISQYIDSRLLYEIQHTNLIEGVRSTRAEIKQAINNSAVDKVQKYEGLAKKYEMLKQNPRMFKIPLVDSFDIRNLYDEIVLNEITDLDDHPDGRVFRKGQVEVKKATQRVIHEGVFPEEKIIQSVDTLLHFMETFKCHPLIKIAVVHYYLGYIHPFYDGNGRLIRFITTYLLLKTLNFVSPFNLSITIKENQRLYEDAFDEANAAENKGDITSFCITFFEILRSSMASTLDSLDERYEAFMFYKNKIELMNVDSVKKDILLLLIQVHLFNDDIKSVTLDEFMKIMKSAVTDCKAKATIREKLSQLAEEGLIDLTKESNKFIYSIGLKFLEN